MRSKAPRAVPAPGTGCDEGDGQKLSSLNGALSVAYVSPHWPREQSHNGIVTYVSNMRPAMERNGTRVFVLARRMDSDFSEPDVMKLPVDDWMSKPLVRLSGRIASRIVPRWWRARRISVPITKVVRFLKYSEGLQLLQQEESFGWVHGVAKHSPVPVVVRLHGPWFIVGEALGVRRDSTFHQRVHDEGLALRSAAGISAPSHDVLNRVRSFYGLALEEAEVIPNPIAPPAHWQKWRPECCRRNHILFVGRFDRCKGGDVIIKAFSTIARAHPDARLIFVGPDKGLWNGSGQRCGILEFIRRHIAEPGIRNRIRYLGYLPNSEIDALRRQCAVNVVCSRYETFGNVALEAMCLGCPVIASDVGGLSEMIENGHNGLLCCIGNARSLAETILRLLRDRALAEQLGRQAAIDVAKRHHPDVIARHTMDFYRRVIKRATRHTCDRIRGMHQS